MGESDLQSQPQRSVVPLPNPDRLGIDTLIYFWERTWGARIPWNEGLLSQIQQGHMAANFPLDPNHPVRNEGRVPVLYVPSLLSDVNKIAWTRAFLGWAHRCVVTKDPERAMTPHTDLVRFLLETYASQGVPAAKPLSERGQGIPVYAAGTEIRTGSGGLITSDWGKKVASGIFVGCKDSESDKGDRVESLFNISFWAKEGAIDWNWLGLETLGKERTADSLAVAMEWMCFKISERDTVNCLLDSPWPCAMAVLRTLQMCEPNDLSVLQMPPTFPWCGATLKLEGNSLKNADLELRLPCDGRKGMCVHLHWYSGGE